MKNWVAPVFVSLMFTLAVTLAQSGSGGEYAVRVALIKMPYVGERNVPDTSRSPDYLEQGGIQKLLEDQASRPSQSRTPR